MFNWLYRRRKTRLAKRVADLEAEVQARDRVIRVQQAEIDALAAVVARDRERVRAETAAHSRAIAESEGRTGD